MDPIYVEKDGIVDFPVTPGTNLNQGVWSSDTSDGSDGRPVVSTESQVIRVHRGPSSAYNVWTHLSLNYNIDAVGGAILQFDLRIEQISVSAFRPGFYTFSHSSADTLPKKQSEVKLQLAADVTLRYDSGQLTWVNWLPGSQRFLSIAPSNIVIGDQSYTRVTLIVSPQSVAVFENGAIAARYSRQDRPALGTFNPVFHWQVLDEDNELSASFWRILIIPLSFNVNFNTPWTIALSSKTLQQNDVWSVDRQSADPIPLTYYEGFMRASTTSLNNRNAWVYPQLRTRLPSNGLITYRIRLNQSTGSESKITVLGDNILRITDEGKSVAWTWYDQNGAFIKLSDSSVQVGDFWTLVTVVFNSTNVALLENGVLRFTRSFRSPQDFIPSFWVQHLDVGTVISVDLSHIQAVPFIKTAVNHVSDLAPFLLAYYPLKNSLVEDSRDIPSLSLLSVGTNPPTYVDGQYGPAVYFKGTPDCLMFPHFPYRKILPSYTLTLSVRIDKLPQTGQLSGIAGPLMVDSNGRLQYEFIAQQHGIPRKFLYSKNFVSEGTWYNIIVSYSYEQSRLSMYLDGYLDSIIYIESGGSSYQAVLPLHGNIGAGNSSNAQNLTGAIGDIMFFSQHVHEVVALALAGQRLDGVYGDVPGKRWGPLLLLLPALFVVASIFVQQTVEASRSHPTAPILVDELAIWTTRINEIIQDSLRRTKLLPKISRADVGIPEDSTVGIDVGGEGRVLKHGVWCGFEGAFNLNTVEEVTGVDSSKMDIVYLVKIPSWSVQDCYPFADNFADVMYMQSAPFDQHNATEFARVIKPDGKIRLWVDYPRWITQIASCVTAVKGTLSGPFYDEYGLFAEYIVTANKNAISNKDELR